MWHCGKRIRSACIGIGDQFVNAELVEGSETLQFVDVQVNERSVFDPSKERSHVDYSPTLWSGRDTDTSPRFRPRSALRRALAYASS